MIGIETLAQAKLCIKYEGADGGTRGEANIL